MIFEKFIKAIKTHNMVSRGDKLIVAVSGGADSLALLHLFLEIRKRYKLELIIGHLNHKLRGEESETDEKFVRELADRHRLAYFTKSIPAAELVPTPNRNIENWAREKRYEFLTELAKTQSAQRIALGHTMNDQAETLLMRLIRGSGTLGLAAIPAIRDKIFIRPLLDVSREEILSYLKTNQLEWREDSSNVDNKFLRNRIRQELIPFLQDQYNPNIIELLSQTSAILREDAECLRELVNKVFEQAVSANEQLIVWDAGRLVNFPPGFQKNLIRESFHRLSPNSDLISAKQIRAVFDLLQSEKSGRCLIAGGVRVAREYQSFIFEKAKLTPKGGLHYTYNLSIPGQLEVLESGSLFQSFIEEGSGEHDLLNRWEFYLTPRQLNSGLWIRNWKSGDAYFPSGASRTKKIKELFAQKKISKSLRSTWPIATIDDKIIFVKGFAVSADKIFQENSARNKKVIVEERKL